MGGLEPICPQSQPPSNQLIGNNANLTAFFQKKKKNFLGGATLTFWGAQLWNFGWKEVGYLSKELNQNGYFYLYLTSENTKPPVI